jgi:hypothetical protein
MVFAITVSYVIHPLGGSDSAKDFEDNIVKAIENGNRYSR